MTSPVTSKNDADTRQADDAARPWSHRLNPALAILVTALAGIASGLIGTFAHRMGASANIPYGLLLAFVLLALSTWCARARLGVAGLAVHLITSSGVVWMIATQGTGDALTPIGFSGGSIPYWSQHVGYAWLIGCIVIQLLMLPMPARWFTIPAASAKPDTQSGRSSADPAARTTAQTADTEAGDRPAAETGLADTGDIPDEAAARQ
ncbi:alcohol dehydrogenase [Bifidobacterium leontopitheci]|nr:alcohol dehydrogenase [Bifidobacterium leontopitheci]